MTKLINLTNHPSNLWGEKQMTDAREYGEIVDYKFPNIAPQCTDQEVSDLADDLFYDILTTHGEDIIVHIMGEFTLCYALIKRFSEKNITCIASCTERNVVDNGNGEKVVKFEFTQFREYE